MYGRNGEGLMGLYMAAAAFEQERARNIGVRQLAEFRASATPGPQTVCNPPAGSPPSTQTQPKPEPPPLMPPVVK